MKLRPVLVALVLLALIECCVFGWTIKTTGFYLDDWIMLNKLSEGPRQWWDLVCYYFINDPRVTIRPVWAVYGATIFSWFGLNPVGYHALNLVLETLSAWLLYACVFRLSRSHPMGFLAAAFLIVYPVHDSTHYWIVCQCASVSLIFYLASWLAAMAWAERGCKKFLLATVLCFAISIFEYELFLPLSALTALSVWLKSRSEKGRNTAVISVLHVATVATLVLYQRKLVPLFATAWYHSTQFDPKLFVSTILTGIHISSPISALAFSATEAAKYVGAIRGADIVSIAMVFALVVFGVWSLSKDSREPISFKPLVLLAVVSIAASFSIFGLNAEYMPTLMTVVNRVNIGATLGWSLLFSGLIVFFMRAVPRVQLAGGVLAAVALALFSQADRCIAQPWVVSWKMQHKVFEIAKANAKQFEPNTAVMLLNCPRYVMWAPVFDGVWDFQSMLQVATGDRDLQGNVVSERLQLSSTGMADISGGYECGRYHFGHLQVLEPPHGNLIPVSSAEQFIALVAPTAGKFGPSKEVVRQWQQSLISTKPRGGAL